MNEKTKTYKIELTERELHLVLAALRYTARGTLLNPASLTQEVEIATNGFEFAMPAPSSFDSLAEYVNTGERGNEYRATAADS